MTSSLGCQEGLRWIREALGVSAADIAKRLVIAIPSYRRFERGERRMYFHQAVTLAHMFDVPLEMLTRRPTTDELLELNKRKIEASRPAPAPALLPRPIFTTGNGLTKSSRPFTDAELRAQNLDPALYVPGPTGEATTSEAYVAHAVADLEHHDPKPDPTPDAATLAEWMARSRVGEPVRSEEESKWRTKRTQELMADWDHDEG